MMTSNASPPNKNQSQQSPTNYSEKLAALRAQFGGLEIDGFILPHQDEYLSEYLPPCAERLAWLTGFTGSAGYAVILRDQAVAMTNGLYEIQIKSEVDLNLFQVDDYTKTPVGVWISQNAEGGNVIGYDPNHLTRAQINQIEESLTAKNITLKPLTLNPIDKIWHDRPAPPLGPVELFPDAVAGHTTHEKIAMVKSVMAENAAQSLVITNPASICWLLNVRGRDVAYNPLVLSQLILSLDGLPDWYVDPRKIPQDVRAFFNSQINFHTIENFEKDLHRLKGPVMIDSQQSPAIVEMILNEHKIPLIDHKDPCLPLKAIKTKSEQTSIKQAHVRDGVAMVKFLYWLDCQDFAKTHHSEMSLADKLEEFRKNHVSYREPSFETISGWADHGAIIHYRTQPHTDRRITGNDLYLLDSGGQYEYGTTDITRTIVIGDIDDERRKYFTAVLQGHIAVAASVFDSATTGADMDAKARAPLKRLGADYPHGTGHGVGCYLGVHEEATAISPRSTDKYFAPGMLLSNEPGYYREDHFGIRHESLMFCQENEQGQLYWNTITLVPFDLRGIDWEIMSAEDTAWLSHYHAHIFEMISPFLDSQELDWLRQACFSGLPEGLK